MSGAFSLGASRPCHKAATVGAQDLPNDCDSGMSAVNRFQTYGLCGLAGISVLATLDSALGLGGGAFLADVCRTLLEGESDMSAGMGDMQMEIKPLPLIAVSTVATAAAICALTREHRMALAGKSAPSDEEQAAILSAMLVVGIAHGRVSRDEIDDVYRIATGHYLTEEVLNLACFRFREMQSGSVACASLPLVATSIGRRRTLVAALMLGCVARPASQSVLDTIENIALDIGATADDISAARHALAEWQQGFVPTRGVSTVTVLRHRKLSLAPV